jgi:hypothetical protein
MRSMPLTATGGRDDAPSVERHSKAVQARYAGRLERFDDRGELCSPRIGARYMGSGGG